jgi:hypothetical protein
MPTYTMHSRYLSQVHTPFAQFPPSGPSGRAKLGSFRTFRSPADPGPTRQRHLPTYPCLPTLCFISHNFLRQAPPAGRNLVRFARFALAGPGRLRPFPGARAKLASFGAIGPAQGGACRCILAPELSKLASFCAAGPRQPQVAGRRAGVPPQVCPQSAIEELGSFYTIGPSSHAPGARSRPAPGGIGFVLHDWPSASLPLFGQRQHGGAARTAPAGVPGTPLRRWLQREKLQARRACPARRRSARTPSRAPRAAVPVRGWRRVSHTSCPHPLSPQGTTRDDLLLPKPSGLTIHYLLFTSRDSIVA